MNRFWRSVLGGALACAAASMPCRADEMPAALQDCRNIADATARLACFDHAAASPARTAVPVPAAPAAATPTTSVATPAAPVPTAVSQPAAAPAPAAPVLTPQEQFGLPERAVVAHEVAVGTRASAASKLDAHIAKITQAPDRRIVFTLDNAQVWRQLNLEGEMLAKAGDAVTISRGLLGSYWLQIQSGRGCKVTRLQ